MGVSMEIMDEDGDLFGLVNAVDVIAVVLILLIIGGGLAVTASTDSILTQQVVVEATGHPPDVSVSIREGPVETPGIVAVENVSTRFTNGNVTVRVLVRLRVEQTPEGLITFDGARLYIGRTLELDLGRATISGTVVDAHEPTAIRSTPTPTPTATPTSTERVIQTTHVVTVEATVSDSVADSIESGPVPTADVVRVVEKTSTPTANATRIRLKIELEVKILEVGRVLFRGVELIEGQTVVLDLGVYVITGEVNNV